jgi:hypothetical protein
MSSLFDQEDLEDTKGLMRIRKTQWPKEKGIIFPIHPIMFFCCQLDARLILRFN